MFPNRHSSASRGKRNRPERTFLCHFEYKHQLFALQSFAAEQPLQGEAGADSDFGTESALAAFLYESLR